MPPASPLRRLPTPTTTELLHGKFHASNSAFQITSDCTMYGRGARVSGSKKRSARILKSVEQLRGVLSGGNGETIWTKSRKTADTLGCGPLKLNRRRRAGVRLTRCWPDLFRTDRRAPSS